MPAACPSFCFILFVSFWSLPPPPHQVDAFQWFLHLITELEHEHYKQRLGATTEKARADWNRYYCEIHMFVTRVNEASLVFKPSYKGQRLT